MMLSLAQIKFLRRYQQKKVRDEERVFVAEGSKLIDELLPAFKCRMRLTAADVDLARLTLLKTPRDSWALFEKPSRQFESPSPSLLALAVDGVQDPGNLGTILRIADWFGINDIYCSPTCADVFSPKTIQSTMGSLSRVRVFEKVPLPALLREAQQNGLPIYGTSLSGADIYSENLTNHGIIVIGSEGNGISPEVMQCVTNAIRIPSFPPDGVTIDSLNVATATAIVCAEFRRRLLS